MNQTVSGTVDHFPVPTDQTMLAQFFSEFLDETRFAEFRRAEQLVASLKTQGLTVSGYPIIRPVDCGLITQSLADIFKTSKPHFRTRDVRMTERFEALVADLQRFCERVYPGQAMQVRLLRAKVRLFIGDADGVIELLADYSKRPYAFEDNAKQFFDVTLLFARAQMLKGTLGESDISFIALGRWAAGNVRGMTSIGAGIRVAPFVPIGKDDPGARVRSALIRWASRHYVRCLPRRSDPRQYIMAKIGIVFFAFILGVLYASLSDDGLTGDPFSFSRNKAGGVLVTRAMGGIGDLLMMAPGLEVNAARLGRPVDFAIPKKFFPIFEHNPHVNLIDIDGPPIDIGGYRAFHNLSQCPASRYESSLVPNVRKGRVEIFARAMGVSQSQLRAQGWRINQFLSPDDDSFCDTFLKQRRVGKAGGGARPLIGIQPFSRDSYKDHPAIVDIIRSIAADYDVLIFHHLANGLPEGEGIFTTAGVPLGRSLALVSRLDAMVCVDSAFLHAAAAFDVPTVAMFGPTDGSTFTRHHKKVKLLWHRQSFACAPCWRNEDLPCKVSRLQSVSPCVASIKPEEVRAALAEVLSS